MYPLCSLYNTPSIHPQTPSTCPLDTLHVPHMYRPLFTDHHDAGSPHHQRPKLRQPRGLQRGPRLQLVPSQGRFSGSTSCISCSFFYIWEVYDSWSVSSHGGCAREQGIGQPSDTPSDAHLTPIRHSSPWHISRSITWSGAASLWHPRAAKPTFHCSATSTATSTRGRSFSS